MEFGKDVVFVLTREDVPILMDEMVLDIAELSSVFGKDTKSKEN